MNILYCGDKNIERGLLISVLSLLKHCNETLKIFVLTMEREGYESMNGSPVVERLNVILKKSGNGFCTRNLAELGSVSDLVETGDVSDLAGSVDSKNDVDLGDTEESNESFIKVIDITKQFNNNPPTANMHTFFTPYSMLRLYADLAELPDKILYLDNDVVCHGDFAELYNIDMTDFDIAGVRDRYGKNFYGINYLNSGVLLMNLKRIRENGALEKCRKLNAKVTRMLPDQAVLNRYCEKKVLNRKFNEQDKNPERHGVSAFFESVPVCGEKILRDKTVAD